MRKFFIFQAYLSFMFLLYVSLGYVEVEGSGNDVTSKKGSGKNTTDNKNGSAASKEAVVSSGGEGNNGRQNNSNLKKKISNNKNMDSEKNEKKKSDEGKGKVMKSGSDQAVPKKIKKTIPLKKDLKEKVIRLGEQDVAVVNKELNKLLNGELDMRHMMNMIPNDVRQNMENGSFHVDESTKKLIRDVLKEENFKQLFNSLGAGNMMDGNMLSQLNNLLGPVDPANSEENKEITEPVSSEVKETPNETLDTRKEERAEEELTEESSPKDVFSVPLTEADFEKLKLLKDKLEKSLETMGVDIDYIKSLVKGKGSKDMFANNLLLKNDKEHLQSLMEHFPMETDPSYVPGGRTFFEEKKKGITKKATPKSKKSKSESCTFTIGGKKICGSDDGDDDIDNDDDDDDDSTYGNSGYSDNSDNDGDNNDDDDNDDSDSDDTSRFFSDTVFHDKKEGTSNGEAPKPNNKKPITKKVNNKKINKTSKNTKKNNTQSTTSMNQNKNQNGDSGNNHGMLKGGLYKTPRGGNGQMPVSFIETNSKKHSSKGSSDSTSTTGSGWGSGSSVNSNSDYTLSNNNNNNNNKKKGFSDTDVNNKVKFLKFLEEEMKQSEKTEDEISKEKLKDGLKVMTGYDDNEMEGLVKQYLSKKEGNNKVEKFKGYDIDDAKDDDEDENDEDVKFEDLSFEELKNLALPKKSYLDVSPFGSDEKSFVINDAAGLPNDQLQYYMDKKGEYHISYDPKSVDQLKQKKKNKDYYINSNNNHKEDEDDEDDDYEMFKQIKNSYDGFPPHYSSYAPKLVGGKMYVYTSPYDTKSALIKYLRKKYFSKSNNAKQVVGLECYQKECDQNKESTGSLVSENKETDNRSSQTKTSSSDSGDSTANKTSDKKKGSKGEINGSKKDKISEDDLAALKKVFEMKNGNMNKKQRYLGKKPSETQEMKIEREEEKEEVEDEEIDYDDEFEKTKKIFLNSRPTKEALQRQSKDNNKFVKSASEEENTEAEKSEGESWHQILNSYDKTNGISANSEGLLEDNIPLDVLIQNAVYNILSKSISVKEAVNNVSKLPYSAKTKVMILKELTKQLKEMDEQKEKRRQEEEEKKKEEKGGKRKKEKCKEKERGRRR